MDYIINTGAYSVLFYQKLYKQVRYRYLGFTEGKKEQREEKGSARALQQAGSTASNKLGLLGSSPVLYPLVSD